MNNTTILWPMFAMINLIFFVGITMLRRRIRVVNEGFDWRYYITFEGEKPPRKSLQTDLHFTNLFEFPLLFFVTCLVIMYIDDVDVIILALAWIFVLSRCWHSYISLTSNRFRWRRISFEIGAIVVYLMWIWIMLRVPIFDNLL